MIDPPASAKLTREQRRELYERTANYRTGYEEGYRQGRLWGRIQGVLIAAVFGGMAYAIARYLL